MVLRTQYGWTTECGGGPHASAAAGSRPLKHRILGTVSFDVPFLKHTSQGRLERAGEGIFIRRRPGDKWGTCSQARRLSPTSQVAGRMLDADSQIRTTTLHSKTDVVLPMRKGWKNALHFMVKLGHLFEETKRLSDFAPRVRWCNGELRRARNRYGRIRALEGNNEIGR